MEKMNKKGWIRIVEAIIGIMIIMAGILYINSKQPSKDISDDVYEKQRQILEIIANNENMRIEIINDETGLADEFILKNIPSSWNFATNICEVDQVCTPEETPNDRDIYTSEIIISSSLTDYPNKKTKKLMFFVWSR